MASDAPCEASADLPGHVKNGFSSDTLGVDNFAAVPADRHTLTAVRTSTDSRDGGIWG